MVASLVLPWLLWASMLVLFDIDSTLINTTGSGIRALESAGRAIFGPSFRTDRTEVAGRLDPLILRDLLRDNGVEDTAENLGRLRAGYRERITEILRPPGSERPLPGVPELLLALSGVKGVMLGLLTGNFADTGRIKLRACGIDPGVFAIAVWGDGSSHDPPSRDHLPPLALSAYRQRTGVSLPPDRATIVGDTPHDVRCALASGMRCLGVGTGSYPAEELSRCGAHRAVADLSDTDGVLGWLLGPG